MVRGTYWDGWVLVLLIAHQLGHKASTTATVITGGASAGYVYYARRRNQIDPQPLMIRLEPQRG